MGERGLGAGGGDAGFQRLAREGGKQRCDARGAGEVVAFRWGAVAAPEEAERGLGGAIAVGWRIGFPEAQPILPPAFRVEAAAQQQAFQQDQGLIAVVGEVARGFSGMVFAVWRAVFADAFGVEAVDGRRVVDPLGAEREGIGGQGRQDELAGCDAFHGVEVVVSGFTFHRRRG